MAPKVLIVLTSYGKYDNGEPTGWFLPELSHPYDELVAAGASMTFASPAGGEAPLDPGSVKMFESDPSSVAFLNNHSSLWKNTTKLSEIDASGAAASYDALFYPGGHGPMFDLATDAHSQALIAAFVAAKKPVAAVCHGPAVFANVKLADGSYLCAGKTVTGFSNVEEDQAQKTSLMPFLLEDRLNEISGGKYVKAAEPWGEKVVVEDDGRFITGQNPASAKGVGQAIVKALSA